jgi:hypothetical protein
LDASRSLLGYILGASWVHLGAPLGSPRAVLGVSWAYWVPRGCLCGPLGGLLGASWSILGLFGGLLGPPWAYGGILGASWGHLEGGRSKKRGALVSVAPPELLKSHPGPLLGRSWSARGRSWGRLGALLGPCWGSGPSWGHLEASDGHRKRKGEKPKLISVP